MNHVHPGVSLGTYLADVEATLADLGRGDVMGRMWRKDHTVWKPDPTEITNRLGWLTITDLMREQVPALESFTQEVVAAGFRHVVLLGPAASRRPVVAVEPGRRLRRSPPIAS